MEASPVLRRVQNVFARQRPKGSGPQAAWGAICVAVSLRQLLMGAVLV